MLFRTPSAVVFVGSNRNFHNKRIIGHILGGSLLTKYILKNANVLQEL